MEEVNPEDKLSGDNWTIKRHTVHKEKYVARHINIWGSEAHTVDSLGEAMEIIDKLEKNKRKLYAGGIGYFTSNKEFDTCIALRTALIINNKFYVQSGAGIVADSKPEKEYQETVNKAKALMKAVD